MKHHPPHGSAKLSASQLGSLHVFLIAAQQLSFVRAAQELCLTASAVSHRIKRLEEALGMPLFHRLPRQIRLTEDGARLFVVMQKNMDELSGAIAQRAGAAIAGQLTLYVRPSVAQCWLIPRLAGFTARYPDVQLDIRVGNDSIDYRTRQIDLVLCYSNGQHPGLVSTHLMPERIAPVCSPRYAQMHGLTGHLQQLQACTLLHDVAAWDNAAFDAEWQLWADSLGNNRPLPQRFLSFDRSDLCTSAAVHHTGLAMGREQLVKEHIRRGELVLPFGGFIDMAGYGYYLVHPPHSAMPRRLVAFIEWIVQAAHQPPIERCASAPRADQ